MSTASPFAGTSTNVFEDALNLVSIGTRLPFLTQGDTVTAISTDDQTFTEVPDDGTTAEVDGTYVSFNVDAAGDVTVAPFQSNQALVDQINENGTSSTALADTLYFQVSSESGISTYQEIEDLGDTNFSTTGMAPYSMSQTVSVGSTTNIAGVTVDKALSTGQTDDSSDPLLVTIAVFDFGALVPDGTLSASASVDGGGGTITTSSDGSAVTIQGTIGEIDADLSTLSYTAVQTGTDSLIISDVDSPTPSINQIVGSIVVQAGSMMPVTNSTTTIFQVSPGGNGSGQGAPFLAPGDTVIGISSDDVTFTPVPTDGTTATVNGAYLSFGLDSAGDLSADEFQAPQSLIDQINANDGAATSLSDNVYYQVEDGSGNVVVDQYTFDLGDTSFGAPNSQPYSAPATVMQGETIDIGGATVAKALSTDGTYGGADPSSYVLSVSIGVHDYTRQASDGTVAIDPATAGGGGTVTYGSNDGSVTIVGTVGQIDADLSTLTYTAVQTGTDYIDISVVDGPVPSANQIIGSIEIQPAATCFCAGALIATPDGEVAVESLRIGDGVLTSDGTVEAVRWIGRRSYAGDFIAGRHLMLPICFAAGSLGRGVPHTALSVSPGHAMLVDGCLVPAWRLVNGHSVTQAAAVDSVTYYHVELDRHAVLLANGAAAESFLDDGCRGQFINAAEFHARYPAAACMAPMAARVEDGFALESVRSRVDARAGLFAPIEPAGELRGFLDQATPGQVCGWAQDVDSPEEPVMVEICVANVPVLCVLANHYRADLRQLGFGSGCHAFETAMPDGWHGAISVRRASDGAPIALTAQASERLAA